MTMGSAPACALPGADVRYRDRPRPGFGHRCSSWSAVQRAEAAGGVWDTRRGVVKYCLSSGYPGRCGSAGPCRLPARGCPDRPVLIRPRRAPARSRERRPSHRVDPGAGRVHPGQVVPRALRADLDHVADHGVLPAPQTVQLGGRADAPAPRRKPRAEDEGHVDQVAPPRRWGSRSPDGRPTLRAARRSSGWASQTSNRRQPALPELADDGVAGKPVLDPSPGRGRLHTIERSGAGTHGPQANARAASSSSPLRPILDGVAQPSLAPAGMLAPTGLVASIYRIDISFEHAARDEQSRRGPT